MSEYNITIIDDLGNELKTEEDRIPVKLKKISQESIQPYVDLSYDLINHFKNDRFKMKEISIGLGISLNGKLGMYSGSGTPSIILKIVKNKLMV